MRASGRRMSVSAGLFLKNSSSPLSGGAMLQPLGGRARCLVKAEQHRSTQSPIQEHVCPAAPRTGTPLVIPGALGKVGQASPCAPWTSLKPRINLPSVASACPTGWAGAA
ncbi:hypothetical protein LX36DRAFT_241893 [Colletotrichum falcatum]|nr:hypothetical protein LX36DRAFT_241893 [Colletotrichum falcatum]